MGATGCGKTTQVPQFILEDAIRANAGGECSVVVTQPRRLSAMAVAERVAAERGEAVGQTVGYSIRLESKVSRDTRLLFCTTGILLRRLQSDPDLVGVTHVVVDEVHERDLLSDFLLVILRALASRRSDFRLVAMSATVDAELFQRYFEAEVPGPIRCVEIPGRTFPVAEYRRRMPSRPPATSSTPTASTPPGRRRRRLAERRGREANVQPSVRRRWRCVRCVQSGEGGARGEGVCGADVADGRGGG